MTRDVDIPYSPAAFIVVNFPDVTLECAHTAICVIDKGGKSVNARLRLIANLGSVYGDHVLVHGTIKKYADIVPHPRAVVVIDCIINCYNCTVG